MAESRIDKSDQLHPAVQVHAWFTMKITGAAEAAAYRSLGKSRLAETLGEQGQVLCSAKWC